MSAQDPLAHPTTEWLHTVHLQDLQAQNPFDPHEIRLSATGGCPRQQTLRILDYEADPPSAQQLSIFHAGHYWEDYLASLWEARYPGQINRQVTVETAWGTGHIDLWIEPIHHLVECKTSTSKRRDDLPLEESTSIKSICICIFGGMIIRLPPKSPMSSKTRAKSSPFPSPMIPTAFRSCSIASNA